MTAPQSRPGVTTRVVPAVTVQVAAVPRSPLPLEPLVDQDVRRWSGFRLPDARQRFAAGRRLLRLTVDRVLAEQGLRHRWILDCPICGGSDHGRPRAVPADAADPGAGAGAHAGAGAGGDARAGGQVPRTGGSADLVGVSLSHTADLLAVAVVWPAGPVGLDLEARHPLDDPMAEIVLDPWELAHYRAASPGSLDRQLAAWWVRKEAVLKAAGVGLTVDPSSLRVAPPSAPPEILCCPPRLDDLQSARLLDLDLAGSAGPTGEGAPPTWASLCTNAAAGDVVLRSVDLATG